MSNQPPPPPPGHDSASSDDQPWSPSEPSQPFEQASDLAGDHASPYQQDGPPPYQQGGQQQGAQQYAAQPGMAQGTLSESEEKTWSILAHLSAPIAALISAGTLNFVGPLLIWALYKDKSHRVRHAAAGAFNFNLSLWIFYAVLFLVSLLTLGVALLITIPLFLVVWVGSMVIHVMAAIKANNGEVYTYPMQIPVLK